MTDYLSEAVVNDVVGGNLRRLRCEFSDGSVASAFWGMDTGIVFRHLTPEYAKLPPEARTKTLIGPYVIAEKQIGAVTQNYADCKNLCENFYKFVKDCEKEFCKL